METQTEIEKGKCYKVRHRRKGTFTLLVEHINGEWVSGVIVEGRAGALLHYNEVEKGEPITVRDSLCTFEEVVEDGQS
jgi:hypothetical protein